MLAGWQYVAMAIPPALQERDEGVSGWRESARMLTKWPRQLGQRIYMNRIACLSAIVSLSFVLAACSPATPKPSTGAPSATAPSTPAAVAAASATPDLCSPENLPNSAKIVNNFVRQFDVYAVLAQTTKTQPQLGQAITAMQAIRQNANAYVVPPCLTDLRRYALLYMDSVIQTMLAFQVKPQVETLNAGIQQARDYNDQYAAELARLLGVTVEPNVTPGTPVAAQPGETTTPLVVTILNPGPNALNLHVSPSLTSQAIGVLDANLSATALGKSSNGEWIEVQVPNQPGKTAWVYASLVQFTSGDQGVLAVATP